MDPANLYITNVTLAPPTLPHKSQKDLLEQDLLRTIFSLKPFNRTYLADPCTPPLWRTDHRPAGCRLVVGLNKQQLLPLRLNPLLLQQLSFRAKKLSC